MGDMSGMGMMMGVGMLVGSLVLLALLGLAIVGAVSLARRGDYESPSRRETAEELLRRRYAAGELDEEEFQRRWSRLHS